MTKKDKLLERFLSVPKDFTYDELKTLGLISNTWAKKYDDYQLEKLNQLAVNFNISAVSKKSGKTKTF